MIRKQVCLGFLILMLLGTHRVSGQGKLPPVPVQNPKNHILHGDRRLDPYFWMRQFEDEGVIAYMEAELKYTDAVMKDTEGKQKKLYREMLKRIQQSDISVPYLIGGYEYYEKYGKGKDHPLICRRKPGEPKTEKVIIDINKSAASSDGYSLMDYSISPGGKYLVTLEDKTGNMECVAYFTDINTGVTLPDKLPNVSSVAWADDRIIYYSVSNFKNRSYRVFRHTIGLKTDDMMVFSEEDEQFDLYVERSKSGMYIFINSGAEMASTNETWYIPVANLLAEPVCILKRELGHLYFVKHAGDKFFILTNKKCPNFRIASVPISDCSDFNAWDDLVAHSEDVFLEDFDVFNSFIAINQRENSHSGIRIVKIDNKAEYTLPFSETDYWVTILPNHDIDSKIIRYGYTSLLTPVTIFDYNTETKQQNVVKKQVVLGDYNPADYKLECVFVETPEGVKIPLSIVYKISEKKESGNPLLLRAYGAYGISEDPFFSSLRFSLIDRGFVFVIAHVRGGSEKGTIWHKEGSGLYKKNSINDFVDCAKYLIDKKYTAKGLIVGEGTGAGAMVVAAAVNSDPQIFRMAILNSPFLDVLTSLIDTAYTGTTLEFEEWGNPYSKGYYDYIKSYSPYDNLKAQYFPNMLVNTSLSESQVPYWEASKFVAKVREYKS
ncbi:MAG: prolyl oligopeptidase family serine peptidase, partial [Bacteroidetes bacterium]|nr:prolyl oligopeptidase family serine peptidase [Bacteroidota bacterium]